MEIDTQTYFYKPDWQRFSKKASNEMFTDTSVQASFKGG